jgi:hypothetical protein
MQAQDLVIKPADIFALNLGYRLLGQGMVRLKRKPTKHMKIGYSLSI